MGNGPGSSQQIIGVPKGGGAQTGIGEKFAPDLQTGTGNFTVPITLPPGRNGFQPKLDLVYSTGSGNSVFGLGWGVTIPGIGRKTWKGIPRYDNTRDVFVLSGAEDLVPVERLPSVTRYQPRTEGSFARIERRETESGGYWQVKSKDGLTSTYGTSSLDDVTQPSRDPAVIADPENPTRIFAWKLSRTLDPFGNEIRYTYKRDQGRDGPHVWDQLYLKTIQYCDYDENGSNGFLVSVEFVYDDNRPDPFSDHRAGFEIRTRKRCRRILVYTHAEEVTRVDDVIRERPTEAPRIRSYELSYLDDLVRSGELQADRLPLNRVSLLSRIQVVGHDESQAEAEARTQVLPPLTLGYTGFKPPTRLTPQTSTRYFFAVQGPDLPATSLANRNLELVDLFGRGLPDILEMNGTVRYWRNLGGGRFDLSRPMRTAPAGFALADAGVQLVDADGDGRTDLLVTTPQFSGYFPLHFGADWDPSLRRYTQAPSFSLKDPEVRLFDLDGDGVTDAVRSGTRLECFFSDPQEGWTTTRFVPRRSLEEFPNVSFSDPRVRWAEMSGDQLQDIVLVHNGSVEYWPSLGYGNWGRRVQMRNSPRFACSSSSHFPLGYNPARVLLGDVDGDGLADLIYVDDGKVTLWINQGGNAWSDAIDILGTPSVTDLDSLRLVDFLGCGTAGILWSSNATSPSRPHMFFLDLTGGIKPYLLNATDNDMGARTYVNYGPSTRFYLEDDRSHWTCWRATLPFPVQVVDRVEVSDDLSQSTLVSEYRYSSGLWDGAEREFRGFGAVEQRDSESFLTYKGGSEFNRSFFSAPTLTRTWFHLGPVGEGRRDWEELDWSSEYWPGDPSKVGQAGAVNAFLLDPERRADRRARRDALRSLRGRILRTELYASDASDREDRPYTVTEYAYAVREESKPAAGERERLRVFFPYEIAQRTTQWERGDDPMTQFSFTGDYDNYGQPRRQTKIACPRGWRDLDDQPADSPAELFQEPYLATRVVTAYGRPNDTAVYIQDRVVRTTSLELTGTAGKRVTELAALQDTDLSLRVFAQVVHYYDGPDFEGLAFGQIGDHGALMRTETLVLTDDLLAVVHDPLPPYLAGVLPPEWTSDYPESYQATVPQLAGYLPRDAAPYAPGLYVATERRQYDFQDTSSGSARGLLRVTRDALGRDTRVIYDAPYQHLPELVTDPVGLETRAAYDYRVLQPRQITDVNGGITRFSFTPLGLIRESWVQGNAGEGDQILPSVVMEYDFDAFSRERQPISVRSTRRLHHDTDDVAISERDDTIASVEYSDGFGRLLQTRIQGEDVRFGDPVLGDSVLPKDQDDQAATMQRLVAIENTDRASPNVVVSGWQRYDNKGRAVEKFEQFFAVGWAYALPTVESCGVKVTIYYDPRGQVVGTVNPDSSEQLVIYGVPTDLDDPPMSPSQTTKFAPTAWEIYTYDANDNAGRTHGTGAAEEYRHHWNTPSHIAVDGLGRTLLSVARHRGRPVNSTSPIPAVTEFQTRSCYDIRGNLLSVVDRLGRKAFTYIYDLANRPLRVTGIDAGSRGTVIDAAGNAIELRDSKGALILRAYDRLNRPIGVWARNDGTGLTMQRERLEYGDGSDPNQSQPDRQAQVQAYRLGRLYRHHDEAGLLTCGVYDFRGNLAEKSRRMIADGQIIAAMDAPGAAPVRPFLVRWDVEGTSLAAREAELLEEAPYETSVTYDALNRPRAMRYPQDVTGLRKTLRPHYNRQGILSGITIGDELSPEEIVIGHIVYNAKEQRTLIAYGNRVMTRYVYDPQTFRLKRLRSERYSPAPGAKSYLPLGRPLQDLAYNYDLIGNIQQITERVEGCGVRNNSRALLYMPRIPSLSLDLAAGNALVRDFEYDPLYRLTRASGRESNDIPTASRPWSDEAWNPYLNPTAAPDPANQFDARDRTRLYSEMYDYDPANNLLQIGHSNSERRYFGIGGFTPQEWAVKVGEFLLSGVPQDWGEEGNRLTHVGDGLPTSSLTHQFDPSGNLIQELSNRYLAWDHANRLIGFANRAGTSASQEVCYLYDASGMRVKKLVRAGSRLETAIYIDSIFERVRSGSDAAAIQSDTLHVLDNQSRVATFRAGPALPGDGAADVPVRFHLGDHLGSSCVLIGGENVSANKFLSREEYYPYNGTSFGSFGRKRYRFLGQETDDESKLHYHNSRYYAPWLSRWISCDPISVSASDSQYVYSADNPIRFVDKNGLAEAEAERVSGSERTTRDTLLHGAKTVSPSPNTNTVVRRQDWGNPERQGFNPTDLTAKTTRAQHALGEHTTGGKLNPAGHPTGPSPHIAASKLPLGSNSHGQTPYWIDIDKAKAGGATFTDHPDLMSQVAEEFPPERFEIYKKGQAAELEVMFTGRIVPGAVESLSTRAVKYAGRGLSYAGAAMTTYDLATAAAKSIEAGSPRPIVEESIRQAGGWAGGVAGAEVGFAAGAAVGIETGPGAVVTGIAGGLFGGVAGSMGADISITKVNTAVLELAKGWQAFRSTADYYISNFAVPRMGPW